MRPMTYPSSPRGGPFEYSTPPCDSPTVGANCRGIFTADVLIGLSREAITSSGRSKGLSGHERHKGLPGSTLLDRGKSLRPALVVLMISITRVRLAILV